MRRDLIKTTFYVFIYLMGSFLFLSSCVPKTPSNKVCPVGTILDQDNDVCVQEKSGSASPVLVSPIPVTNAVNAVTTDTSFPTAFSVTPINTGNVTTTFEWRINGVLQAGITGSSFNPNPSVVMSLPGVYALQVSLVNPSAPSPPFDTYQWSVTVSNPGQAVPITRPSTASLVNSLSKLPIQFWRVGGSTLTSIGNSLLEVELVDGTNRSINYYLNSKTAPNLIGASPFNFPATLNATVNLNSVAPNFAVELNNKTTTESHTIIAEIIDTTTTLQVGSDLVWTVQVDPLPMTALDNTVLNTPPLIPPFTPGFGTVVSVSDRAVAGINFDFSVPVDLAVNGGINGSDGIPEIPAAGSGLSVQFNYKGAPLDALIPQKDMTVFGYSLNNYLPAFQVDLKNALFGGNANNSDSGVVEAIVTDKYSNREVGRASWVLQVNPLTLPVVSAPEAQGGGVPNDPFVGGTEIGAINNQDAGTVSWTAASNPAVTNVNPTIIIPTTAGNQLGSDGASGLETQFYVNGSATVTLSAVTHTINPIPTVGVGADTTPSLNDALQAATPGGVNFQFQLPSNQIPGTATISAEVRDVYRNIIVASYFWPVSVRPPNLRPEITKVFPDPATNPVLANQGDTIGFRIDADDLETATNLLDVQFELDGVAITAVSHPGSLENCNLPHGGVAANFICDLSFPSFGPTGPINSGVFTVTSRVQDQATPGPGGGPSQLSADVIWTVNVSEQNPPGGHIIQGFDATAGVAGMGASNSSFSAIALAGSPADRVAAFSEGDTINVHIRVRDPERDTFRVTASIAGNNGATIIANNVQVVSTNADDIKELIATFVVPEDFYVADPGDPASIPVTLTVDSRDEPDSAAVDNAPQLITAAYTVNNTNPAPIANVAGALPNPATPITTVFPGTNINLSFNTAQVTDASTGADPNDNIITYKWQVASAPAPDCSAGSADYVDIDNANGTVTGGTLRLDWVPNAAEVGNIACFRLCFGDSGLGNDVNTCATNVVWQGGANNFATIRNNETNTGLAATPSLVSTWHRPPTVGQRDVYMAIAQGGSFRLEKHHYDANGALTAGAPLSSTPLINSDPLDVNVDPLTEDGNQNNTIQKISITGDVANSQVFVAIQITDTGDDGAAPKSNPDLRVFCFDMANIGNFCNGGTVPFPAAGDMFENANLAIVDLGEIVVAGTPSHWMIPFIDTANANSPSVVHLDVGNVATGALPAPPNCIPPDPGGGPCVLRNPVAGTVHNLDGAGFLPGFTITNVVNTVPTTQVMHIAMNNFTGDVNLFTLDVDNPSGYPAAPGPLPELGAPQINVLGTFATNLSLSLGHAITTPATKAVYLSGSNIGDDLVTAKLNLLLDESNFSGTNTVRVFPNATTSLNIARTHIIPHVDGGGAGDPNDNKAFVIIQEDNTTPNRNLKFAEVDFTGATIAVGTKNLNQISELNGTTEGVLHVFKEPISNMYNTGANKDFLIMGYVGTANQTVLSLINLENLTSSGSDTVAPYIPYTTDDPSFNWAIPYIGP